MAQGRKDLRYYNPNASQNLLRSRDRAILFDIIRKYHPEVISELNNLVGPYAAEARDPTSLTLEHLLEVEHLYQSDRKAFEADNDYLQGDLKRKIHQALLVWAETYSDFRFNQWALDLALEKVRSPLREVYEYLSVYLTEPETYETFVPITEDVSWKSPKAPLFTFELMSFPRHGYEYEQLKDKETRTDLTHRLTRSVLNKTNDYDPSTETRAEAEARIPHLLALFEERLWAHFDAVEQTIKDEGWKILPKKRARTLSKLDHYFWLYFRLRGITNREIAEAWADEDLKQKLLGFMDITQNSKSDKRDYPELLEAEKAVSKAVSALSKSMDLTLI